MPNPRVRFDESGEPKVCLVKVPTHLAKVLYRAALRARQGKGGIHVEESDLVISLIQKWAETQEPVNWPEVLEELKEETRVRKEAGQPAKRGTGGKTPPETAGEG